MCSAIRPSKAWVLGSNPNGITEAGRSDSPGFRVIQVFLLRCDDHRSLREVRRVGFRLCVQPDEFQGWECCESRWSCYGSLFRSGQSKKLRRAALPTGKCRGGGAQKARQRLSLSGWVWAGNPVAPAGFRPLVQKMCEAGAGLRHLPPGDGQGRRIRRRSG